MTARIQTKGSLRWLPEVWGSHPWILVVSWQVGKSPNGVGIFKLAMITRPGNMKYHYM
jgi:hypothetical protein